MCVCLSIPLPAFTLGADLSWRINHVRDAGWTDGWTLTACVINELGGGKKDNEQKVKIERHLRARYPFTFNCSHAANKLLKRRCRGEWEGYFLWIALRLRLEPHGFVETVSLQSSDSSVGCRATSPPAHWHPALSLIWRQWLHLSPGGDNQTAATFLTRQQQLAVLNVDRTSFPLFSLCYECYD